MPTALKVSSPLTTYQSSFGMPVSTTQTRRHGTSFLPSYSSSYRPTHYESPSSTTTSGATLNRFTTRFRSGSIDRGYPAKSEYGKSYEYSTSSSKYGSSVYTPASKPPIGSKCTTDQRRLDLTSSINIKSATIDERTRIARASVAENNNYILQRPPSLRTSPNVSRLPSLSRKQSSDAINDDIGSGAVLTRYKHFSDSGATMNGTTGTTGVVPRITGVNGYDAEGTRYGLRDETKNLCRSTDSVYCNGESDVSNGCRDGSSSRLNGGHRVSQPPSPIGSLNDYDSSSNEYSPALFKNRRRVNNQPSSGYGSDNVSTTSSGSGRSGHSSVNSSPTTALRETTISRRSNGTDRYGSQDKKGLVGLRNLGNTCFMNSVLQCLSNTRPLLEYVLGDHYLSDINSTSSQMKGALIKAFASLMQSMWKNEDEETAINPQAFKSQIQKFAPRFMGYSQQDAQEFLRYLLSGLHEDVNRVKTKPNVIGGDIEESLSDNMKAIESWKRYLHFDDSKIVDLFVGQLKSTLKCTTCGHCSVTFDPFWDLSLPIPKSVGQVKLSQCLDFFTKEEILDGDEKPTCAKCKQRRRCTKSFRIYKFPKVLVLHLKRFSPTERYRTKLSTNVDFPFNLDLSTYAELNNKNQSCGYSLYSVSNHSGSIYSGHYTAYCKNPYSHEWNEFNDARVSKVSTNSLVSSEAYVLFYELSANSQQSSWL